MKANKILKHWNMSDKTVIQIDTIHKSAWEVDGEYILKHNSNAGELSRSIQLANLLSSDRIPVAVYIPTTGGKMTTPCGTYCLIKKIRGSHIDFFCSTRYD